MDIVQISETHPPLVWTPKVWTPGRCSDPPRSLDTKSLKVYIRSASFVGKVPILVVFERLEVLINVTIMISTTGMVYQLPFNAKNKLFSYKLFGTKVTRLKLEFRWVVWGRWCKAIIGVEAVLGLGF